MLIQGTLHKQAQQGIKLECSLGQFSIYDARLEALQDGSHAGMFELAHIKANMHQSINVHGLPMLTLESIVELKSFAFFEGNLQKTVLDKTHSHQVVKQEIKSVDLSEAESADKELFSELWPLGDRVKLDETHPKFREQVKRMNEFKALKMYTYIGGDDKVWIKLNKSSIA